MCVCYYGVCTSPGVLVNRAKEYMNVYTVCTYLHTHVHIHIKEHTRTQFISISTSHCIYWNLWLYTDTSNSNPTLWQVCCNSAFHVCQTPSMTVTNLAPCTCNQPCSECSLLPHSLGSWYHMPDCLFAWIPSLPFSGSDSQCQAATMSDAVFQPDSRARPCPFVQTLHAGLSVRVDILLTPLRPSGPMSGWPPLTLGCLPWG